MEDPETLLALCVLLRDRIDLDPAAARDEAEFFFQFLSVPQRAIGLFDERHYFLGELALLAGAACRHLSRRVGGVDLVRSVGGGLPPHGERGG